VARDAADDGAAPAISSWLPRGGTLPTEVWRRRHRGITVLAWLHVPVLFALILDHHGSWPEALASAGVVAALAAGGSVTRLPRVVLASSVTLSLLTSTALLIHTFHGLIEVHFHFFVVIAVVAMYQQWTPYLIALGYVLLHHAALGVLLPEAVYNHDAAFDHPVRFAIIHGGFVLAESIACLAYWKLNEQALAGEREQRRSAVTSGVALERANDELADLMAMLSHDLRTPLTVINGTVELMGSAWEDLDDDAKRQMVARVDRAGRSLSEMLEETLMISVLDGEGVSPWPVEIDLEEFVDAVVHTHFADHDVTLEGLRGLGVCADRQHLTQVVTNLLNNAIKYGAAPYAVRAQPRGEDVALTISDSGDGVPAEFVPHLFDRYSRAEAARAGATRGTGLGLYIVQQLVLVNGGSIGYRHRRPHGSEFEVVLPGADRAQQDPALQDAASSSNAE
jgi:signal transduction histidine kinase